MSTTGGADATRGACTFTLDPSRGETEWGADLTERWECPHEAHPEAEHCPFHMPAERRDALGLDDAAVRDAFVEAVRTGGQDPNAFVGARFGDLDLRGRVLDAGDRFPVDLRGATVEGTLTLVGGAVRHPLLLDGADLSVVEATDATFDGRVSASGASVGEAEFRRTTWSDRVEFEGSSFDGEVTFRDASFDGRTTFRDAAFDAGTFAEATFGADAVFAGARFDGDAGFEGTEFAGGANVAVDDADFSGATFAAGAAFEMARFRAASFEGAAFGGPARFERAAFDRRSTFAEATFDGPVAFDRASVRGDLSVAGASFDAEAAFDELECEGDAVFEGVTFGADTSFAGAEFRGGSNLLVDDADFEDATFEAGADFHMAQFRYAAFAGATFDDRADFADAEFARGATFEGATLGPAAFESATFGGDTTFGDATLGAATFEEAVFDDDVSFAGVRVTGDAGFEGAEFRGGANVTADDADFSGATFEADATFEGVTVRWARFDGATVAGEAVFDGATFDRGGSFAGLDAGGLDCYRGWFGGESTFAGASLGRIHLDETVFDADVSFADVAVEEAASLRGVEFRGGANVTVDDADFSGARFDGPASFRDATFRSGRFDDATFAAPPTFDEARFRKRAEFRGTVFPETASFRGFHVESGLSVRPAADGGRTLFDLRAATLERGEIARATDGDAYYDLTGATLGRVHLVDDGAGGTPLFDHFLFDNTEFDGFDFSRHRHYLEQNRWEVHDLATDFAGFGGEGDTGSRMRADRGTGTAIGGAEGDTDEDDDTDEDGGPDAESAGEDDTSGWPVDRGDQEETAGADSITGVSGVSGSDAPDLATRDPTIRESREFPPEDLEATYLKAKNGAQAVGDNHAMSEFFMKEMGYRRAQYVETIREGSDGTLSRPRALGRWATNVFFSVTCGYGERPSRVILVSTVIIAVFAVFFAVLGVDMANTSFADPVVYSLQSYTSLVLDPPRGSNAVVNVLTAVEGFVGGFLIALFVFSLTRSLHR